MVAKKSMCFLATVEYAVDAFLYNHIRKLSKHYQITVITNNKTNHFLTSKIKGITVINVNFSRSIKLFNDTICLLHLIKILFKKKFDVITTITPKAGLLGNFAAFLTFVPIRVHCFTGQIWATQSGLKRCFFKFIDKFINAISTHIIVDGKSQYDFLLNENVINKNTSYIFAHGSICGVDLKRFIPNKKIRSTFRNKFNIPHSSFVFLFVGRLNTEKGIYDLLSAFKKANLKSAFLLLVGPDEENFGLKFQHSKNVIFHDFTLDPQIYMSSCDVLSLPSYREGFGNVVIEAAASGIPSIVSNVYGLSDFVVSNKTGLVHKVKDVDEMVFLFKRIFNDKLLAKNLGERARKKARKDFDSNLITKHWIDFYKKITSM